MCARRGHCRAKTLNTNDGGYWQNSETSETAKDAARSTGDFHALRARLRRIPGRLRPDTRHASARAGCRQAIPTTRQASPTTCQADRQRRSGPRSAGQPRSRRDHAATAPGGGSASGTIPGRWTALPEIVPPPLPVPIKQKPETTAATNAAASPAGGAMIDSFHVADQDVRTALRDAQPCGESKHRRFAGGERQCHLGSPQ